ncbi:MAG: CDP-alcohol phosphatidyltransferase family protein [Thiofilum sp.]|uniref:CDP-alcohol phosphatidyltransferase family protein n=1 Tax=Thiofilum sp. TaxID=2212733 RepID=UPI0025F91104|nr:CDP-alcohol phosphatidyltransferase family protein [Thiofilum sp.]MBK8455051.1 CDP-alcohol phosphatidyltransferase family protein [Thiofilum sp.]
MATIYDLKPAFQNLLRPLVASLAKAGISPNQITIAALVMSLGMGLALTLTQGAKWLLVLLPLVLLIRMALNALDGLLAKEHQMQTPLGAMLNELGDVISDAALYLPFALLPNISPTLVVLFVITALLTEMAGLLGKTRRYDGPMGKSDRAFLMGTLGLLLGLNILPSTWVNSILIVALILSILTIINRCHKGLSQ